MNKILNQLEKSATGAIFAIKIGTKTPEDSGIGRILNKIKELDEPMYESLMTKYKAVLAEKQKTAK